MQTKFAHTQKLLKLGFQNLIKETPSRSEYVNNMLTEFPKSRKFPQIKLHSPSRETRVWKRVITIIKGNTSASTQPLMNSFTLKNLTRASIFCIRILVIFTCVILLKVWCYSLLFTHSYLAFVVVYDNLLQFNLNVNTFCTHIIIILHFCIIFFAILLVN